jgi:hypothetical protein
MSETDFSREHAERAEAQRFELEKMRERLGLKPTHEVLAEHEATRLRLWRLVLLAALRQRAFLLCLQADSIATAIISGNRRRR